MRGRQPRSLLSVVKYHISGDRLSAARRGRWDEYVIPDRSAKIAIGAAPWPLRPADATTRIIGDNAAWIDTQQGQPPR